MNEQPKQLVGKGFTKGDSKINRGGRPRHYDAFRKLAQRISHERVIAADGSTITLAEQLLRSWAKSRVPALQLAFAAYCWGKPPERVEVDGLENRPVLILHHAHQRDRIERERRGLLPPGADNGFPLLPAAD